MNFKWQPLNGFKYQVVVNEVMGTFQIIEKDTDRQSDVMDDVEYYIGLKALCRKGRKRFDDACDEVMQL